RPAFSAKDALTVPSRDYSRIILPPSTYAQEQEKVRTRFPAALKFIADSRINDSIGGELDDIGIVLQGGLYNGVLRALELLGHADSFGTSRVPLYVLNVTYPLLPEEFARFCAGKRAVLIVEEGQPEFIEQAASQILRKHDLNTKLFGKDCLPMAGEYTADVLRKGLAAFLKECGITAPARVAAAKEIPLVPARQLAARVPARPSGLCTGCPERPFFSAMKILQREIGPMHISADIGCHSFATLPPFNMGNSIMGYGLGPAGASALSSVEGKRAVSVMGDGGFWHNGLTSGIGNAVFNRHDVVTVIVDNGYSAATGGQDIPSSRAAPPHRQGGNSIVDAVKGVGATWVKRVHTYDMRETLAVLREALTTDYRGPKVIVAEGECQLNRQRRVAPQMKKAVREGKRVVRERFGVDPETCTGDHSCIRLSGCPSLTIKDNPDPLRTDPVAHVDSSCVGCGVCGEVAHAAVLCPSFYSAELLYNPSRWDRLVSRLRAFVIGALQQRADRRRMRFAI
ncbi:MAG: thiamine pyrophosphate-dependent enzyme, partial [Steroidobacteraceae bacterium]